MSYSTISTSSSTSISSTTSTISRDLSLDSLIFRSITSWKLYSSYKLEKTLKAIRDYSTDIIFIKYIDILRIISYIERISLKDRTKGKKLKGKFIYTLL